jgi:hypothetical protein
MLRILYLSLFLLAISFTLSAQVGLSTQYLSGSADNWTYQASETGSETIELPGTGWQAGIDYWFRLKNTRIEFLPTLAYSQQTQDIASTFASLETEARALHFFFNTNIYLFDLKGDCDCPTFSKQGPSLQKGFYLQVSPGYSLYNFELQDAFSDETYEDNDSAFSIGLGLGIDLGISDFMTITPQIGARYYPSLSWETLDGTDKLTFPEGIAAEDSMLQYYAGLRLGFRFDQ